MKRLIGAVKALTNFHLLFPFFQSKNFWMDDVYFGRQRLAGCNPAVIKLCTEIPSE